jgi:MFS family permease
LTYRQLLKGNADFRRLWTGQVISEIGDWLNNIAVLALTIQLAGRGREGLAIAIYAVARHLPLFVFGPIAGVVVDRVDRRRVMVAADVLRAVLALGFIIAGARLALPLIYVVGASLFSVSAFFNAAKRASIPQYRAQRRRAALCKLALGFDHCGDHRSRLSDGRHHRDLRRPRHGFYPQRRDLSPLRRNDTAHPPGYA